MAGNRGEETRCVATTNPAKDELESGSSTGSRSTDQTLDSELPLKRKRMVMENDWETEKREFSQLWDYRATILDYIPGSAVHLVLRKDRLCDRGSFHRLYYRLGPQKNAFMSSKRALLGVKGYKLRCGFGGHLLLACSRDANYNVLPIAIALVEADNRDTWSWFLHDLITDLGSTNESPWTWITPFDDNIISTVKALDPEADYRICLNSLYAAFTEKFWSYKLCDKFWSVATAPRRKEFIAGMEEIRQCGATEDPYSWLLEQDPNAWALSHFNDHLRCSEQVNFACDEWMRQNDQALDMHGMELLEWFRVRIAELFAERFCEIDLLSGIVCPVTRAELDDMMSTPVEFVVGDAIGDECTVVGEGETFRLDLKRRMCSCRRWQVSGVPCMHAVACMMDRNLNPQLYVDDIYGTTTFAKTYSNRFQPIPERRNWTRALRRHVAPPTSDICKSDDHETVRRKCRCTRFRYGSRRRGRKSCYEPGGSDGG